MRIAPFRGCGSRGTPIVSRPSRVEALKVFRTRQFKLLLKGLLLTVVAASGILAAPVLARAALGDGQFGHQGRVTLWTSRSGPIFDHVVLVPGHSVRVSLRVGNAASARAAARLTAVTTGSHAFARSLKVVVHHGRAIVWSGRLSELRLAPVGLLPGHSAARFTFEVTLPGHGTTPAHLRTAFTFSAQAV